VISYQSSVISILLAAAALNASAAGFDELKVKREQVFEFTQKPVVTIKGDKVTIAFTSKAYCDATVAIENPSTSSGQAPRIIRHLASGVLGKNAPPPFKKNSHKQVIVWDGKDDQGTYVDDKGTITVRVSLGLKPQFERTLFWSPHKRYGGMPLLAATPEGVYVFDGKGVDFIRQFDHEGDYVRAVYPFPRNKLKDVKGLNWYDFPQGYRLPRKGGLYQVTLLTSGANVHTGNHGIARKANGATAMAVRGKRLALVSAEVCRIATDGSSGGLNLRGAKTGHTVKSVAGGLDVHVGPSSVALSPDGKTLYLTGYLWQTGSWRRVPGCKHVVYKLDYEKGGKPTVFMGHDTKHGDDNQHFRVPTSVACDAKGRVYVSDYLNDRIQVYDPSGKYLKTLKTPKPAKVCVNQKTGEVWAFSYPVFGVPYALYKKYRYSAGGTKQTVTRFSALPECKKLSYEPFPMGPAENMGFEATGHLYHVEVDSWAKEPTVWVVGRKHNPRGAEFGFSGGYDKNERSATMWEAGIRIQRLVKGKWQPVRMFGRDAKKKVVRARPPKHNIQRLIVHPLTGMLYVAEPDSGPTGKASNYWLKIDPETGKIRTMRLPFNAMEAAFDLNNNVYLRNTDMIVRYNFDTWREVPWDYGTERKRQGNDGGIHGRSTSVIAGLKMPSTSPVCYHQGGIAVSAKGDVIASCAYRYVGISSGRLGGKNKKHHQVYKPQVFPGRVVNSTSPCIHVWDKHGKVKYEDALPGVGQCNGVGIDRDDNIYVMQELVRAYNGKRYFNEMSETLLKVRPKKSKIMIVGRTPVPLQKSQYPNRPPDFMRAKGWITNAEWLYGGVGFAGFNMIGHGGGCACWFARFTLDYFARSIAPEPHQYRVAMLDSAGNLILHIGRYGNVDDGRPCGTPWQNAQKRSTASLPGEPPNQRSIGGDEVSLMHACFVGTHTDRRVFIADYGNARIVSVKLNYHATEKVALKDVADR
jgi:SMP-30/gluconolaconase/LRE-like protein